MGNPSFCGFVSWLGLEVSACDPEGMEYISGPAKETDPEGEIAPFWIDATEVTQGQFRAYQESVGSEYREFPEYHKERFEGENKPMIYVSWNEARAYCRAKGGDLPTKAQWVKAARGPEGKIYGTESGELRRDEANYFDTISFENWEKYADIEGPKDVANYAPNDYGLYDMTANVAEWVLDDKDSSEQEDEIYKQVCGDAWHAFGGTIRTANDCGWWPFDRSTNYFIGFRCVVPD